MSETFGRILVLNGVQFHLLGGFRWRMSAFLDNFWTLVPLRDPRRGLDRRAAKLPNHPMSLGRSAVRIGRSVDDGSGGVWVSARGRHRRHSPPPPPGPALTAPTDQPAAEPPTPPELDNRRARPAAPPPRRSGLRLIGTTAYLLDLLSRRIIFNCRLDF